MLQPQALPSGTTTGDRFARELALLLGTAYQPADGSLVAEDLRAIGDALADAYDVGSTARDQAIADRATDLLPEWEAKLGLITDPTASTAARQTAIRARRRATGGDNLVKLLANARLIDPAATITLPSAVAVPTEDDQLAPPRPGAKRTIFQFLLVVTDATFDDPVKRAALRAVIDQARPAYVRVNVVTGSTFHVGPAGVGSRLGRTAL